MDNESKTVGSQAVESMSSRRHLPPPLPPPHGAGDGPAPTTPLQLPRSSLAGEDCTMHAMSLSRPSAYSVP